MSEALESVEKGRGKVVVQDLDPVVVGIASQHLGAFAFLLPPRPFEFLSLL